MCRVLCCSTQRILVRWAVCICVCVHMCGGGGERVSQQFLQLWLLCNDKCFQESRVRLGYKCEFQLSPISSMCSFGSHTPANYRDFSNQVCEFLIGCLFTLKNRRFLQSPLLLTFLCWKGQRLFSLNGHLHYPFITISFVWA